MQLNRPTSFVAQKTLRIFVIAFSNSLKFLMKNAKVFSHIFKSIKPFKFYITCHLFVVIFNAIETSLWPYLSKLLIDNLVSSNGENVFINSLPILIPLLILTALPGFVWRIADYAWMYLSPLLRKKITADAMDRILTKSSAFFHDNFAGALANRVKELANSTPNLINVIIFNFISVALSLLIALYVLFHVHFIFALGLLIWSVIFIKMAIKSAKETKEDSRNITVAAAKVTGNIVDVISNFANVRLFLRGDYERKRNEEFSDEFTHHYKKRSWFLLKFYTIHGLTFSIYFCSSLIFLVYFYARQKITIGDFALILTINNWIIHAMWQMAVEMRTFIEDYGNCRNALRFINNENEFSDAKDAKPLKIDKNGAKISFEKVEFSYEYKKPRSAIKPKIAKEFGVLNHETIDAIEIAQPFRKIEADKNANFLGKFDVEISSGQKVALVGKSGAGKSTFVNLLLRNFDLQKGKICINGQDVEKITAQSLFQNVSIVSQETSLFHRSLFDNIAYAKESALMNEVLEAAKKANCLEFVEKLPLGFDSFVGERGVKLSGGQKQRIAIARAFLKNSPILILDEATSQLDSINEELIQDALRNLMRDKTVIVIAHRLATIHDMDRILVFEDGRIVEDGPHEKLLKKKGVYYNLWERQVL